MIMVRTLRRDIARYNTDDNFEDTLEETGWKLIHGDVFRPPRHPRLFAAIVGSGIQIFFMALITICKVSLIFKKKTLINFVVFAYSCGHAGHVVAIVSWCPDDGRHLSVRRDGPHCRLLFGTHLQNDEGSRMEAQRILDGHSVSGHCVWHMLFFEFLHLGSAFQRCRTVQYDAVAVVFVVWHFGAARLFGLLFRLSQATVSASGSDEHDTETGADATVVHEFGNVHVDGGHFAIRCRFH